MFLPLLLGGALGFWKEPKDKLRFKNAPAHAGARHPFRLIKKNKKSTKAAEDLRPRTELLAEVDVGTALLRVSAALERIDPRQPGHAIYCQERERTSFLKRPLDVSKDESM